MKFFSFFFHRFTETINWKLNWIYVPQTFEFIDDEYIREMCTKAICTVIQQGESLYDISMAPKLTTQLIYPQARLTTRRRR